MNYTLKASFALLICTMVGCTATNTFLFGQPKDAPQSQEMNWGSNFKIRVTQSSWSGSELRVAIAMTYNGNDPAVPHEQPIFQLQSADGKHFQADNAIVAAQLTSSNFNPGTSRDIQLTFSAPRSSYVLLAEDGGRVNFSYLPPNGPVILGWTLQPTGG